MEEGHAHGAPEGAHEGHHTSIFPFIVALSAGFGFGGLAIHSFPVVGVGVGLLVVGVGGWLWQDAKGISFALKGAFEDRPFHDVSVRKIGMWIFIVSEIFFFTGLIASGLALRVRVPLCPEIPTGACWPSPTSPDFPLNIPLTAVNTFILIVSSFTMAESLHFAQLGKQAQMRAFLLATLLLGAMFVSIQVYEYSKLFFEEFLTPWPNATKPWFGTFGTAFYTQTGFHGAHVTGGLLALAFLNVKAWRGKFGKGNHEAIELVGLYWHLVDIVWIFLFPIMYLIGR